VAQTVGADTDARPAAVEMKNAAKEPGAELKDTSKESPREEANAESSPFQLISTDESSSSK
jgi:hypothetical protein